MQGQGSLEQDGQIKHIHTPVITYAYTRIKRREGVLSNNGANGA